MLKKFHWKLTLIYLGLFLISFIIAGEALTPMLERYFENGEQQYLEKEALLVRAALEKSSDSDLENQVKHLGQEIGIRITIIGRDGNVYADSEADPALMENHRNRPEIRTALSGRTGSDIRASRTVGYRTLYLAIPATGLAKGEGAIRLAVPMTDVYESVDRVLNTLMFAVGLALALSTVFAFFAAQRFTEPIREVNRVAREYARGNFRTRMNVRTSDEIGSLGRTLNEMAEHLQTTIAESSSEKNKMRAVLTGMADGVVAVDPEGRIILVNHAAEMMFHHQEGEVLGKHILRLVRNFRIEELVSQVLHSRNMLIDEFRTDPGTDRIVRIYVTPIRADNSAVAGIVLVFRDVTELRQLEQMRTDFVANVSHELKTPLTSIKGFVETLLDGALEDQEACRRFLGIISEETDRLHRLIADLLSLARIEAPRFEAVYQAVSLTEAAAKNLEMLRPQAEAKRIRLSSELEPGLPRVLIKEDLLDQVVLNLLDNAVKYTQADGNVVIRAELKGNLVQVEVADTGIGIPEECLPRIFERFYRVDKARSRDLGGTGLGLSIVKHILERYGQKIWVRSVPGEGSVFGFTLAACEDDNPNLTEVNKE